MAHKQPRDGLDEILHAVEAAHLQDHVRHTPPVEIIEEPQAFILSCDLPTADREDIRVDVSPHRVVIAVLEAGALPPLRARGAGRSQFERAIPLPAEVLPESAEARLNNGVLEVVLPKRRAGGSGVYVLPAE